MGDTKLSSTPLASYIHLSKNQSPETRQEEERDFMTKVLYVLAIGSLMYAGKARLVIYSLLE